MSYNYTSISNYPEERQRIIYPFCFWEGAFSNEEIDTICKLMNSTPVNDAYIASPDTDENIDTGNVPIAKLNQEIRRSKVSFHRPNESNQWIFDRLNALIDLMNKRWYNFDLNGYDQFQYTEYYGNENGRYGWHCDLFLGKPPKDTSIETRKLSLSLLLNNPGEDFEGGELQFGHESAHETANMKKGSIVVFPSFQLHQVKPITKGVRKSIVIWVVGPKWK